MASTFSLVEDWKALRHKSGFGEREIEPEIEELCKEIVMRSGGQLLVGIMLNNMLKAMTANECKVMLLDFAKRNGGQAIQVVDVLKFSYYALPPHLRPCLLLFGHFPKNLEIETDTLYQLWIAEGLVSMADRRDGEKMMDVAARYLDELAEGSWVQMQEEENLSQGRFKSCLDDAIRDLCISKVKDDELVDSLEENNIMSSAFRLAISLEKFERTDIHCYRKAGYLRSLLLSRACQSDQGFIRPRAIPNLDRFTWLRVLYLCVVDFKGGKFLKGVEKIIYLRFLSFRECYLVELSSSVGNFLYLQTLDLRVRNECEMHIPDVLGNLEKLRYLYLPLAYRSPKHGEKLNLGKLKDLEIVENFNTSVCNPEDLSKLINLTDLSLSVEEKAEVLERILKYLDKHPRHWRRVSLDIRNFDCYTKERISIMERVFNSSHVRALGVEGHLEKVLEFAKFSSKLTKIVLNGSELEDDPIEILQKLTHLQILVLEIEAFVGKKGEKIPKKMKCSSLGFPQLRYLKLSKLYELEQWEVEKDAMTILRSLAIENCKKLRMLPEGLKFIIGLRKLEMSSMPPEFVARIQTSDGSKGFLQNLASATCEN